MKNISIRYNDEEDMMEIRKNSKVIFYGNYWDFSREPTEIKKFLENCGLVVAISDDLEGMD